MSSENPSLIERQMEATRQIFGHERAVLRSKQATERAQAQRVLWELEELIDTHPRFRRRTGGDGVSTVMVRAYGHVPSSGMDEQSASYIDFTITVEMDAGQDP